MAVALSNPDLLTFTARIVSAHVSHNAVPTEVLPAVIKSVYDTLSGLEAGVPAPAVAPVPAVPVKRSVFPDYIVCLEDGEKLKMLKRHLRIAHGMTPEQYRERWGLPRGYPMAAPKYAAQRSALAKAAGLGRKPSEPAAAAVIALPRPPPVQKVSERAGGKVAARKRSAGSGQRA